MKNEQLAPSISRRDYDAAQELTEQGHSAEEVRKVVAGDSEYMLVDNIETPVRSIGESAVNATVGGLVEPRNTHEWARSEKNPRG